MTIFFFVFNTWSYYLLFQFPCTNPGREISFTAQWIRLVPYCTVGSGSQINRLARLEWTETSSIWHGLVINFFLVLFHVLLLWTKSILIWTTVRLFTRLKRVKTCAWRNANPGSRFLSILDPESRIRIHNTVIKEALSSEWAPPPSPQLTQQNRGHHPFLSLLVFFLSLVFAAGRGQCCGSRSGIRCLFDPVSGIRDG